MNKKMSENGKKLLLVIVLYFIAIDLIMSGVLSGSIAGFLFFGVSGFLLIMVARKVNKTRKSINELVPDTSSPIMKTDPSVCVEPKFIYTKVVGVTYDNDDGTNRQDNIELLEVNDDLELTETEYKDEPAYIVEGAYGQIGFLKKELAAELYEDSYLYHDAKVKSITGGGDKSYGCNIEIICHN